MIVDAHTHFYDPSRPQGVPWPPESDDTLFRTVLPDDFAAVAGPCGVSATVVVEASGWVEDNQWVLDLAEADRRIVGFVGGLDPRRGTFTKHLDRFRRNPLFRGVRARGFAVRELLEDAPKRNLEALAEAGLALDLLAQPQELPHVATLAGEFPTLRMVLDHVTHVPVTGTEPPASWRRDLATLEMHGQVYCKVSGLVEAAVRQPAPEDPAYYVPTLNALWDVFGAQRLIWASNWPVCEKSAPYDQTLAVVTRYLDLKAPSERESVFWGTSKAAYRWLDRA
jgi:L-fuconolactonase